MLRLFQFEPKYGLPNVSPFCMKVETFLRMAKIQYAMQIVKNPRTTPKGKAPYINDDGTVVADSAFIVDYLTEKYHVTLDRDLTGLQRGIATMTTGALEERLYFVLVYSRWVEAKNWEQIKQLWFSGLPPVVRSVVPGIVRKGVIKTLNLQGIGRHSRDEIYALGIKDLKGLVQVLGDQKYLLGAEPTSVDAVVFAFVANILKVPLSSPLFDYVADQHELVSYCQRMGKKYFPEYAVFQS
ncbi:MAG: glutathione S-transferase family protein [Gammaproteobacteria bacterium]|nr:glutathione S-transferase family protein [Gammaproteobacteria bacterium]